MNAPIIARRWQAFAKATPMVSGAFAMVKTLGHCREMGQGQHSPGPCSDDPSLTPFLRSGPSQAGPIFEKWRLRAGQRGAVGAGRVNFCFEIADIAVESRAITTNQRGSLPCASRLSFSSFSRCRWPVACRTLHRAVLPVPLRAPLWPTLSMKTSSRVLPLVALPVPPPAGSSLACRPATRATDRHLDPAAFGRAKPTARTIRASRPGGPLRFTSLEGGR
jgi:hypothetical protein